jgi:geranylgeranyl pyrophosphate synthase
MLNIKKMLSEFSKQFDLLSDKYVKEKEIISNLSDAVAYCLKTKGKRVRPFLCLEVCKRLGGDINKAIPFSVAIDLMHNWILIHDDIEDGDTVRRDKPAVWIKYGLAHGVNIGDYLQNKVYQAVLSCKGEGVDSETTLKLIDLIAKVLVHTTQGQAMDINLRTNNNPTEDHYMVSVMYKAGYYLACPILGGAIIAGASDSMIEKLTDYGQHIGPAFQIQDDLIDLTIGKGRNKTIGNDIREGKRTLLVIHCLSKCDENERENILLTLDKEKWEKTDEDVSFIIKLFEKYNSKQYAARVSRELIEKGKTKIRGLPSALRIFLESLADFTITRET